MNKRKILLTAVCKFPFFSLKNYPKELEASNGDYFIN